MTPVKKPEPVLVPRPGPVPVFFAVDDCASCRVLVALVAKRSCVRCPECGIVHLRPRAQIEA